MDSANERTAEEVAWIHRIGQGDKAALQLLYQRYASRIFRFVIRMIKDEAKAEELVNDVMMEIWKSAASFEGRSSPSTWILGIARFRTLNAVRGKKLDTVELSQAPEAVDEGEDASTGKSQEQLRALMRQSIARLSDEHREVVELTFFHDCSYKEIAEILQCPENTVKTRMYHAKAKLKPWLKNMGLAEAELGGVT
ncbi:RNA polymerase subunit sigma [Motiliproteus coralliicola]|uniref:RNA polymerase subunit sigma n=1 Tax=Motiliproteus coralliicola TaxID=2283196 RepID=A0A369WTT1_9GAMM|nr:sigma-70 family RNA polymerase sigma factor [Motiliproteus coralliicola]RDE24543.1 RNA polymerase subunit sigma [Motiliproteus coralliicola]